MTRVKAVAHAPVIDMVANAHRAVSALNVASVTTSVQSAHRVISNSRWMALRLKVPRRMTARPRWSGLSAPAISQPKSLCPQRRLWPTRKLPPPHLRLLRQRL